MEGTSGQASFFRRLCVCCQLDCGTNPSLQLCSLGKVMPLACPMVRRLAKPREMVRHAPGTRRPPSDFDGTSPPRDFRPYYGYLEKSSTPAPARATYFSDLFQRCRRWGVWRRGRGGWNLVSIVVLWHCCCFYVARDRPLKGKP